MIHNQPRLNHGVKVHSPYLSARQELAALPCGEDMPIAAHDAADAPAAARKFGLYAAASCGLLMLAGCNQAPAPNGAATQTATTAATVKKLDVRHAAMVRSPNLQHNIIAVKNSAEVDGKQILDNGKPLAMANSADDRIVANIQDNGQYILMGTEGIVVNGQWVRGGDGQKLLALPSSRGATLAVGMNSGGHWVAANYKGIVADGKVAVDPNGKSPDIASSEGNMSADMTEDGHWTVFGTRGFAQGQVDVSTAAPAPTDAPPGATSGPHTGAAAMKTTGKVAGAVVDIINAASN